MGTMAVGGDLGWWGPEGALKAMWCVSFQVLWRLSSCSLGLTSWNLPGISSEPQPYGQEPATSTPRMPLKFSLPAKRDEKAAEWDQLNA